MSTAEIKAQRNRLNEWAERASNALCKVRPLGGSELFLRVDGISLADPEYCGAEIDRMRDDLHQARCRIARLMKAIEPFALLGRKLLPDEIRDAFPNSASARFLDLTPISAGHFRTAAEAVGFKGCTPEEYLAATKGE